MQDVRAAGGCGLWGRLTGAQCVELCAFVSAFRRFMAQRGFERWTERRVSGQWRAMRDGNDGIYGNPDNVVSVTYRF